MGQKKKSCITTLRFPILFFRKWAHRRHLFITQLKSPVTKTPFTLECFSSQMCKTTHFEANFRPSLPNSLSSSSDVLLQNAVGKLECFLKKTLPSLNSSLNLRRTYIDPNLDSPFSKILIWTFLYQDVQNRDFTSSEMSKLD